jgi:NADH:ubiquinone oxidoreductase subunit 3 (subunit A)
MLDITIIFLFQNILLLTLLFWFLSWVGGKFFKEKNTYASFDFFECGFNSVSNFNIKLNFNIFFVCILLILYDVEFLFLVPYFYNFSLSTYLTIVTLVVFTLFILSSFIYDWELTALNWHF